MYICKQKQTHFRYETHYSSASYTHTSEHCPRPVPGRQLRHHIAALCAGLRGVHNCVAGGGLGVCALLAPHGLDGQSYQLHLYLHSRRGCGGEYRGVQRHQDYEHIICLHCAATGGQRAVFRGGAAAAGAHYPHFSYSDEFTDRGPRRVYDQSVRHFDVYDAVPVSSAGCHSAL